MPLRTIDIRPLEYGEEERWLSVESGAGVSEDGTRKIRGALAKAGPEGARCFLLAIDGDRPVGRLEGVFLNPKLYFIRELLAAPHAEHARVGAALASHLGESFAAEGVEVLSWDRPDAVHINAALERAGFVVKKEKVFVEKDLEGFSSPHEDPFTYRSLAEVGEDRFLDVMAPASEGDPFEDASARDPRREFSELVSFAGSAFDATWWRAAYLDHDPIGVVLPQSFANKKHEGTLFYVAVIPEFRGRGFGRILHATGLAFLADHGVSRYIGSTDARNLPMIAVFRTNGCEQTGRQLFYGALRREARRERDA
jgi:GNAT superfamily N-acetyltransferase